MKKLLLFLFISICIATLFSCRKEYSHEIGNITSGEASLWDSIGNCYPITVHGTYYNGVTPGPDTAYVEVQVNVTQTGSYKIETDQQNGFSFADSGTFTTTGLNTIKLKPLGVPIIPTTSTFAISFDSTTCAFVVVTQDSASTPTPAVDNAWQFTTSDGTFTGIFDSASIEDDKDVWRSGGKMLVLEGSTTNAPDSVIALYVFLPTGAIVPGSYTTLAIPPANAALFAFIDFTVDDDNGTPIYTALPISTTGSNVTVNIISYDNATNIVTGKFTGEADNKAGASTGVTNGSFTATVTP